ncbi:MAG: hypothetical protein KDI13_00135 [Alphaproteobacteria bacterium]|nr:hypothetical protein [Alphaproteobacteria bacterium]
MGAIQSVLGAAQLISQGASLVNGVANSELSRRQTQASQDLALKQLQAQQTLQERQLAAQNALEKEKIATQAAQSEADRKSALRRAVARQRANFGAQGVGSGAGSSQAVLLGLFDESDAEKQKREQLDALRTTALDQDLAQNKAQNVLQRTQLAQRNSLDDLSSNYTFARNIAALGGLF